MTNMMQTFYGLEKESVKWDTYFDAFETHLTKYIDKSPNVLEIGIAGGGSLEFWSKFFRNGQIYGIDINEKCLEYQYSQNNIHIALGDQGSPDFWDWYLKDKPKFDVIIDDGSHINEHQILTMIKTFPHLKECGTFIMEDTHTSYWEGWNGGFGKKDSCIEFSKGLIDLLHKQHINMAAPPALQHIFHNLKSVTYYNSMIIMVKDYVNDMKPLSNKQR
jgi:hypothetical protein